MGRPGLNVIKIPSSSSIRKKVWQGEQRKEEYVQAKKQYTNLVRRKKRLYQSSKVEKLRHMRNMILSS